MGHAIPACERFWRRVDTSDPDGCWLWPGKRSGQRPYGQFRPGTRPTDPHVYAHRFAYCDVIGPVPEGHELHHRCEIRLCVNPRHLEPVTHSDNVGRAYARYCKRGHNLDDPQHRHPSVRGCYTCKKARQRERSGR